MPEDSRPADLRAAMGASHEAQAMLAEMATQISKEFPGIQFINPGVKTNVERIMQKVKERGGVEKVTDLVRGTFTVDDPELLGVLAERLAERLSVAVGDWHRTNIGYIDQTLWLRFPNGLIGEVKVLPPEMYKAKMEARPLYEEMRELSEANLGSPLSKLKYAIYDLYPCVFEDDAHHGRAWVKFDPG